MDLEEGVNRFLTHVLYEKGYSRKTLKAYQGDLTHFLEYFYSRGLKIPAAVSYRELHRYVASLGARGIKASSLERKTASVKSLFKFLVRNGVIKSNPAALLASPKKEKRLPSVLEKKEMTAVLNALPESEALTVRDKAMVLLLYATGLRVSELTGLDFRNVDLKSGVITVAGKGGKERLVPMGDKAVAALRKYLVYRGELSRPDGERQALFLSKNGKRIQDRMVNYILKKIIRDLSIQKKVSPHTLRHTFATHLLQNGAGIRVIQEILGHSSLSTTQVYTHLTVEKLKESYDRHHPHS